MPRVEGRSRDDAEWRTHEPLGEAGDTGKRVGPQRDGKLAH